MKTILWAVLLLMIVVAASSSRLTLQRNENDEDRQSTPTAELRHPSNNRSREFNHYRQHHNHQSKHHHRLMHKQHEHNKQNSTTLLGSGKIIENIANNMTRRNLTNNSHIVLPRTTLANSEFQPINQYHNRESMLAANRLNDNRTIQFEEPNSQLKQPQTQSLKLRRLSYDQPPQLEDSPYQKQTYQVNGRRPYYRRTIRNYHRTARNGGAGDAGGVGTIDNNWSRHHHNNNNENGNSGHTVTVWKNNNDDILRDVEQIEVGVNGNDWVPQIPSESTTTTTTTELPDTEELYNSNRINGRRFGSDSSRGNTFESDSGRHICMQHRTSQVPVKTTEVYSRPIWKRVQQPCQMNLICTRVQLVHEPAYRDIIRHKTTKQIHYDCCPGWGRLGKNANACMKPICSESCRNGGTCVKPDECSCPPGYDGKYCEKDINECQVEKPCDQLCFNTNGSYYCKCRDGFQLQSDLQSCRKNDDDQDDAFEARDLENEIDTNEVTLRLHKIEKTLASERLNAHEFQKTLQETSHVVESLQSRLTTMEKQQQNINHLQMSLMSNEAKTQKLENLVNILFKCRTNPGPYCT